MGSQLTRSRAIHFHFGTRVVTLRRAAVTDDDKGGQRVKRQALAYLLDTTMLPFPPAEKTKWWYDDALGYALCIYLWRGSLTENRFRASSTRCMGRFIFLRLLYLHFVRVLCQWIYEQVVKQWIESK